MSRDIANNEDIDILMTTFYGRVRQDDVLGPIFNKLIIDWNHHLPLIAQFWRSVLFMDGGYRGNVIGKHIEVNKAVPLEPAHYEIWLQLWRNTIDNLFSGPVAEDAKYKANNMAQLLKIKIAMHQDGKTLL